MKRLLFITGEGVGNVIQCIPCLRTIRESGVIVDLWLPHGSFNLPKIIPYVDRWFAGPTPKINYNNYYGAVFTKWAQPQAKATGLPLLSKMHHLKMDISEVSAYMKIAEDLKIENVFWHGNCMYSPISERYDVVISNGFNYKSKLDWSIKAYQRYPDIVDILKKKGLTTCSIGAPQEYVPGTVNKTNTDILTTFGLIKNAKIVISNDSGMYHAANALETPNIAIFTATSIDKNYDKRFHLYSSLVFRDDLKCRPCQARRTWLQCKDWKCRDIDPEIIINKVEELI